jgi:hypothetical protein
MSNQASFPGGELFPQYPTTAINGRDVGCMDDRPWENLWLQIGGGVYGIAEDRAAAMELEDEGSFNYGDEAAAFGHSVPVLAGVANGVAQRHNVRLRLHGHCAAYDLAATNVAEVLSDSTKEEGLFGIALSIHDQLKTPNQDRAFAMFRKGLRAYRRVIDGGGLPSREEAETDLMHGRGFEKDETGLFLPPSRVELTQPHHEAGDVVITHTAGVAFDSARAWEQGRPAYNVSRGAFGELNGMLNGGPLGQVDERSFSLVSAARHAAIISVLPRPEGQDALRVHEVRF